jgi:putative FmdB family regulatory protein
MPIYAYRCTSCGHAKDVLQKVSDPLLTECPACGAATFVKQVTAAGFQLKGSGWYVTDFRGGNSGAAKGSDEGAADKAGEKPGKPVDKTGDGPAAEKSAGDKASGDKPSGAQPAAPQAAPAPAAAPTPASGPAAAPTASR